MSEGDSPKASGRFARIRAARRSNPPFRHSVRLRRRAADRRTVRPKCTQRRGGYPIPHETPLITTIVGGLVTAFILGTLAQKLRLSPLVGYLLAGVMIGPFTPGFVANQDLANQLAEIGVILLMFGVGLHFSVKDLLAARAVALPGAVSQMAVATLLGAALGLSLGWPLGSSLVFGIALSVASTVVLIRAVQERRLLESEQGRIAVGWLIVEDLAMVLALVLLPALSEALGGRAVSPGLSGFVPADLFDGAASRTLLVLAITGAKIAAFLAVMLLVGRRFVPRALQAVAHTGSRELFRLSVLAIALGVAYGSAKLFDVSFALGAFFAGMLMAESPLSQRATEETLPLRDAFAVLFFVSVGMLFDPMILARQPGPVLATLGIIVIGKSIAAFLIVLAFKRPVATALTISVSLAQIGEFSFILATLGLGLEILAESGRDLIIAGALLSILINPMLFLLVDRFSSRQRAAADASGGAAATSSSSVDAPELALGDHTVLVGYGRVGSHVGQELIKHGRPFVVIEDNAATVERLRSQGVTVVRGSVGERGLLAAANLASAKWLISAIPSPFEAGHLISTARTINPTIQIVARAHTDAEVEVLRDHGADFVVYGEREIAREITRILFRAPDGSGPDRP